jgi:hypothetical protein
MDKEVREVFQAHKLGSWIEAYSHLTPNLLSQEYQQRKKILSKFHGASFIVMEY